MNSDEFRNILQEGTKELGLSLGASQVDACQTYLVHLKKWNRQINLTAIENDRDIAIKHFLDSFSYIRGFGERHVSRLLDMGSGAGFPAIPIKILLPDLQVTLVESVKKKASFLRHIARTLQLSGVEILDRRTDELAKEFFGIFDVVTARAFAEMGTAIREGRRFLYTGGIIVLSRGPDEALKEEMLHSLGMVVEQRKEFRLPQAGDRRTLWTLRKE
ncbi:MAG: 16S rRNA (guanine(527)-N(7))-methyltransferase RsmG [Nitrospiraceae bacterium]|nr:16S rRNA (guanine(527)-N(7))-methyltransferase RsmG [Nitrospiraceae bacterium]